MPNDTPAPPTQATSAGWKTGDAARGRPLAEQARRLYQEMGADLRVPPIDAWLAAHPAAADGDEG